MKFSPFAAAALLITVCFLAFCRNEPVAIPSEYSAPSIPVTTFVAPVPESTPSTAPVKVINKRPKYMVGFQSDYETILYRKNIIHRWSNTGDYEAWPVDSTYDAAVYCGGIENKETTYFSGQYAFAIRTVGDKSAISTPMFTEFNRSIKVAIAQLRPAKDTIGVLLLK